MHEEHLLPNEPESLARHSHGAVPKLSRFSAKITVSGVVYDAEGEPAIGATVALEGQPTAGVTTDFDGNYEIKVAPNAKLVYSLVGCTPQTIAVDVAPTSMLTLNRIPKSSMNSWW